MPRTPIQTSWTRRRFEANLVDIHGSNILDVHGNQIVVFQNSNTLNTNWH